MEASAETRRTAEMDLSKPEAGHTVQMVEGMVALRKDMQAAVPDRLLGQLRQKLDHRKTAVYTRQKRIPPPLVIFTMFIYFACDLKLQR